MSLNFKALVDKDQVKNLDTSIKSICNSPIYTSGHITASDIFSLYESTLGKNIRALYSDVFSDIKTCLLKIFGFW